jgi:hypothetical protein
MFLMLLWLRRALITGARALGNSARPQLLSASRDRDKICSREVQAKFLLGDIAVGDLRCQVLPLPPW